MLQKNERLVKYDLHKCEQEEQLWMHRSFPYDFVL